MPTVEHSPTQISPEWRLHRQHAKRYYPPWRARYSGFGLGVMALTLSMIGMFYATQPPDDGPQTVTRVVGGSIFALVFLLIGLLFGYLVFHAPYSISSIGFELGKIPYAAFATWENITVVTYVEYTRALIIGIEFRPPEFETHWFMRWIARDLESPILSFMCSDSAACRAALDFARNIEPITSRASLGGS